MYLFGYFQLPTTTAYLLGTLNLLCKQSICYFLLFQPVFQKVYHSFVRIWKWLIPTIYLQLSNIYFCSIQPTILPGYSIVFSQLSATFSCLFQLVLPYF